jgi:ABC-type glycerol-3-phosphate transport system substrate-binding protein/DNA-binding transcriptional regulator YhcF (GntR family)
MIEDKVTTTRKYILEALEKGKLCSGDKLPGARDIAKTLNISFLKVQQALEQLAIDGVLQTVPRQGTFVQKNWKQRILQSNFTLFNSPFRHFWSDEIGDKIADVMPQVNITNRFEKSVYELRTTIYVQNHCDEYMDLAELLEETYPDKSIFFSHPFKGFIHAQKLIGVPLLFSPRVMMYNPDVLRKAGCKEPRQGWTWEDLIAKVRKLRSAGLPGTDILNWDTQMHVWMNIIFRAGGCIISSSKDNPVCIDHPKTQNGLRLYMNLKKELGIEPESLNDIHYYKNFAEGNQAFIIAAREYLPFLRSYEMDNWKTVPLPLIDGGLDITAQATELLCIRKSCTDLSNAKEFLRIMLSENIQDMLAEKKYGIPIRKSSALKSFNPESAKDMLFLTETNKISAEYNINSAELSQMISTGLKQIMLYDLDVELATSKLAEAVRLFLAIKQPDKNKTFISNYKKGVVNNEKVQFAQSV